MTDKGYARSIDLPSEPVFRNVESAKLFAIDVGGSLCKLAYSSTVHRKKALVQSVGNDDTATKEKGKHKHIYKISGANETTSTLHFVKFETKYIESCLDFIQQNVVGSSEFSLNKAVKVTGGGAYKYKDLICEKLGVEVDKEDEMECLIKGCNFLLRNIPDEAFVYRRGADTEYVFQGLNCDVFPYLLVNIGSGVSILKVESENKFQRIGGTSIGGGTFWGLGCLLTRAQSFDELLELAEKGDPRTIDLTVKDIYGGDYGALGLSGDLIASSFGKAARIVNENKLFPKEDIAKSLLIAISNDIGQIAYLNARLHGLTKIYFGGYFIRGHPMTMHTISFALNHWSKGGVQAMFLRHEGYLGAVGAFLKCGEEKDAEKYSWSENYIGSSGLQSPRISHMKHFRERSSTFDMLELDSLDRLLVKCPLLLDRGSYLPDTVDLTQDTEARQYWLDCFETAIDKFVVQAIRSEPDSLDAETRANKFKEKYVERLNSLKTNPTAYGSLTVRSLLDTREHCMQEFHFIDPYSQQKQFENETALKFLENLLKKIDSLPWEQKQLTLVRNVLTGNVFDWGAKEVAALMERPDFGFEDAQSKLEARPWLVDDYDSWLQRLQGPPHNCAVIFCDNSGMDIILGLFPFARELLSRGTKVVLCANTKPALNDVTYPELIILTERVAAICTVISEAYSSGDLIIIETGSASPCLDLRCIDVNLAKVMEEEGADLIVLEGMGRAVHTNYDASFACEALKIAVLKNRWLANRLGGQMFSVVFKYELAKKVIAASSR